jgi:carbon storage regulator
VYKFVAIGATLDFARDLDGTRIFSRLWHARCFSAYRRNGHISKASLQIPSQIAKQRSVLMLVLTRKAKQQIQIGPYVTVTILQIKGGAVRVGIQAPKDVTVLRTELAERLVNGDFDPTISAAVGSVEREAEINSSTDNELLDDRTSKPVRGSLRCRAPREDAAPLTSPYPTMGSASLLRPRRRRTLMK